MNNKLFWVYNENSLPKISIIITAKSKEDAINYVLEKFSLCKNVKLECYEFSITDTKIIYEDVYIDENNYHRCIIIEKDL